MTYLAIFLFPPVAVLAGVATIRALIAFVVAVNKDLKGTPKA